MITDHESFLCVTDDGRIWWSLKDAIRLGAGFLPVRDDHQTLLLELRAPNNRARVNERTILGAFGNARSAIERPMTFERDGFCYVDAEGFLDWLSQYIAQTQAKITFPNVLASEVRMAVAKAAASRQTVNSEEFKSLTLVLDGWFDKKLDDLQIDLRECVEREFFPNLWDVLSADQRRSAALQLDYQNDPATEQDRQYWWNFFVRLDELETKIDEWESAATPTASDIVLKESRLKELQQELDRMELQKRQARGDYYPERKRLEADKGPRSTTAFIAYPKAMKILGERWKATPEELAAWIYLGPETGGIVAYRNANELNPPPRFFFAPGFMGQDYLSPLMACWFRQDDIDGFEPADRYITGAELIERWSKQPGLRPEAFIRAKIAESRLLDMHPTFGGTQGIFDEYTNFPPLSAGLFAVSHVERIEDEDALDSAPVLPNSDVEHEPIRDGAPNKGGRPKGPLAEAVEMAYLYFHAAGNVDILKPGNVRPFLKSLSELAKKEVPLVEFGNRNIADDIGERIKDVKIPFGGKCSVTTQDRQKGNKTEHGKSYSQGTIAKLLTALRKKYPILS